MSIAKRESILRRNPYRDRRSFVARAMGLSPIGDIASGGMSEDTGGGSETLTWSSATDWDNAVSESGVAHESVANTDYDDDTAIRMGYSYTNPFNTGLEAFYTFDEDSGTTIYDHSGNGRDGTLQSGTVDVTGLLGTTGFDFDEGSNDWADMTNHDWINDLSNFTSAMWIKFPNTSGSLDRIYAKGGSGNDNVSIWFDSGNMEFYTDFGGGERAAWSSPSTGTWHFVVGTTDGSTTRIYANGTEQNNTSVSGSLASNSNPFALGRRGDNSDQYQSVTFDALWLWSRTLSASEVSTLYDVVNAESSLTTDTKTFSSSATPDLQNLSYSLNSQSIVLDVIGSPGTASEEVVSQTLDGSTSYSLTWSNSHTDFRVKARPSTSDVTTTPTVNRVELVS